MKRLLVVAGAVAGLVGCLPTPPLPLPGDGLGSGEGMTFNVSPTIVINAAGEATVTDAGQVEAATPAAKTAVTVKPKAVTPAVTKPLATREVLKGSLWGGATVDEYNAHVCKQEPTAYLCPEWEGVDK